MKRKILLENLLQDNLMLLWEKSQRQRLRMKVFKYNCLQREEFQPLSGGFWEQITGHKSIS